MHLCIIVSLIFKTSLHISTTVNTRDDSIHWSFIFSWNRTYCKRQTSDNFVDIIDRYPKNHTVLSCHNIYYVVLKIILLFGSKYLE